MQEIITRPLDKEMIRDIVLNSIQRAVRQSLPVKLEDLEMICEEYDIQLRVNVGISSCDFKPDRWDVVAKNGIVISFK